MKNHRIIFLGTPEFAVPALEKLIDSNYRSMAVITEPDRPAGRGKKLISQPIKLVAQKYDIPVYQPTKIKSLKLKIKNLQPTVAVVVAYGQIIPKEILEIPKFGFINIHPSLLPLYRGPSPIQAAILNGDKETGVTIIKLDEKMDHGDVVATEKHKNIKTRPPSQACSGVAGVANELNYLELSEELANLGAELLLKTLTPYLSGKIKPKPQDHSKATYTKLIKKSDGLIDWNDSIEIIDRKIRAYNPWPSTYTFLNSKRIKICQAHINCDKLIIDEVQPEGKSRMSWSEFANGNKDLLKFVDIKVLI